MKLGAIAVAILFAVSAPGQVSAQEADPGTPDPLAQIRGDHILISTADFDGTIAWYRDKLGFKVTNQWGLEGQPEVKIAYVELNGFKVEIIYTPEETREQRIGESAVATLGDRGYVHLAFLAPDVDAVARELEARGVPVIMGPISFPDAERRLIFIRDNNGNLIEFVTPLDDYETHSHAAAAPHGDEPAAD